MRDEVKKRGTPIIDDDDSGSIDLRPAKINPTCGACRTRDSKVWWKAPKGLSTNILCERCGPNWRRYADLNVRPVREESITSTKRKALEDSRDCTPTNGAISKRVKVKDFQHFTRKLLIVVFRRTTTRKVLHLHPTSPNCVVMHAVRMVLKAKLSSVNSVISVYMQVIFSHLEFSICSHRYQGAGVWLLIR